MTNILKAIYNISKLQSFAIAENYKNSIRIQQVGDALEYFVKDAFCDGFAIDSLPAKEELYSQNFSFGGSANHPPDFIIKNGDAVEVKKIQGNKSTISLNSSYPKAKLFANDIRITKACRECEEWAQKDIIYAIGTVKEKSLRSLWLVYGTVYAAEKDVYEKISNAISGSLKYADGVVFSKTKELGNVKKIDPLGITSLRVRGMWGIEHPSKVFNNLNTENNLLNVLITEEKYNSFPQLDIAKLEREKNISINKTSVKNPNNTMNRISTIHISIARQK